MTPGLRKALTWIRSLHIYLSLAAFLLLFFFTLSGWLMVHQEQLGLNEIRTREWQIPLAQPEVKLNAEAGGRLLEGLEIPGRLTDCAEDYAQVAEPGTATWVELDRVNGRIRLVQENRGTLGRWFDLHRNRHTSPCRSARALASRGGR